jgi:hypothetical protein
MQDDQTLPADCRIVVQHLADQLLKQYQATWLGELGRYVEDQPRSQTARAMLTWRRGWIDRLTVIGDPTPIVKTLRSCPAALLLHAVVVDGCGLREFEDVQRLFVDLADSPVRSYTQTNSQFGDVVVDEIIRSGLLARLRHLELTRCGITDDGALALSVCRDIRRLTNLVLAGNLISPIGAAALAEAGITIGPQYWDAGRGDVYV